MGVVTADNTSDDYTVEVAPKVAADPDTALMSVKLSERNQYNARFFLSSATYRIRLTRPDGSVVMDVTEFIPPGRRWTYDLVRPKQGSGHYPTTRSVPMR
jgi:hypothetical protein